jgi:sulfur transfer protein SufE
MRKTKHNNKRHLSGCQAKVYISTSVHAASISPRQ